MFAILDNFAQLVVVPPDPLVGIGQWTLPYAPTHWIIAKSFAAGVLDLWEEPYFGGLNGEPTIVPGLFTITVTYADGPTATATGIPSGLSTLTATTPPPPSPALVPTPSPPSDVATLSQVAAGQWKLFLPSLIPYQWRDAQGKTVDDLRGMGSRGFAGTAAAWTGAAYGTDRKRFIWGPAGGCGIGSSGVRVRLEIGKSRAGSRASTTRFTPECVAAKRGDK
jgi:hypothetical protein